MFGLSEAGGTKRCTVCKSTNLRTNAQKALICCDCLTVVEERRIYTDDFKEYKNPKVSKKRDYLQEKVKNKGDEQFESFRDHLHKNWVFYLHVFQKHLRRISNFLSRAYGVPKLEETTKDLWIAYLSKWREKAYPLVSKFTFSNPGNFEVRPRAGMRKGETISSIPQRIISKLEEQDEEIDLKIERKKSMNYDMIFGDLEGTKGSKNKGGGFLGLQSQEEIVGVVQADEKPFLDSRALNGARRYHLRSKRRFLSSRKSVSKKSAQNALGMGRRRKSSLTTPNNPNSTGRKSTLTEAEQDKLRALEELEVSWILI